MVTPSWGRAAALAAFVASPAWQAGAQEVSKLSTFQPLTVQDAYPTKNGTVVLETSGIGSMLATTSILFGARIGLYWLIERPMRVVRSSSNPTRTLPLPAPKELVVKDRA